MYNLYYSLHKIGQKNGWQTDRFVAKSLILNRLKLDRAVNKKPNTESKQYHLQLEKEVTKLTWTKLLVHSKTMFGSKEMYFYLSLVAKLESAKSTT